MAVSSRLRVIGEPKGLDKSVPYLQYENQKNDRFEVSSVHLLRNNNDIFLDITALRDETWTLYDNLQSSAQSLDYDEVSNHFQKPALHRKKVLVTVWWSVTCVNHHCFLNTNRKVRRISTAYKSMDCTKPPPYVPYIGQYEETNSSPWQCPAARRTTGPTELERNGLQDAASFSVLPESLAHLLQHSQASSQLSQWEDLQKRRRCQENLQCLRALQSEVPLLKQHKWTNFLLAEMCRL